MVQHCTPISIHCICIQLQLFAVSGGEEVLYHTGMIVHGCQVQDVIIFIGQFVQKDLFSFALRPDI